MYVNDIQNDNLLKAALVIEEKWLKPEIFTSKGEILYYFWQLVKNKIKPEDFVMFLDTFFNKKPYEWKVKNWYDAVIYFKNLDKRKKRNKIFVFDKVYEKLLDEKNENVFFV